MHYSIKDLKHQINAAKANNNETTFMGSKNGNKFTAIVKTEKKPKADIYPIILVNYQTETEKINRIYHTNEIKLLQSDLNSFINGGALNNRTCKDFFPIFLNQ